MHAAKSLHLLICLLAMYLFSCQVSAEAFCSGLQYGYPSYQACDELLLDNLVTHTRGIEGQDRKDHAFVPPGTGPRPIGVTMNQWRNKVVLPEIWESCVSIPCPYRGDRLTAKSLVTV